MNGLKYLLTRTCEQDQWIPVMPPECNFTQENYELANKCPPSFDNLLYDLNDPPICVRLTLPQAWNAAECAEAGSEQTILELNRDMFIKVTDYLRKHDAYKVWIPAKWNLNTIRWMLPSKLGEVIAEDEINIFGNTFRENGCVLMSLDSDRFTFRKTDCTEYYPLLCFYNEEVPLKQLACSENTFTTRYKYHPEHLCYSISNESHPIDLYKMNSDERSYLYSTLFKLSNRHVNETCVFNPLSENRSEFINKLEWEDLAEREYVNWNRSAEPWNADRFGSILLTNNNGKWSFEDSQYVTCTAYQSIISVPVPQIRIELVLKPTKQLQVNVTNKNSLWKENNTTSGIHCFGTDEAELVEHSLLLNTTSMLIETDLHYGYYWCEAYSIANYTFMSTDKLYVDRPDIFAGSVHMCTDCFQGSVENEFEILLRITLSQTEHKTHILIENAFIRYSETMADNFIRVWFSVTLGFIEDYKSSEPNNLNMTDKDMLRVYHKKNILAQLLQISPFFLASVNSTEYCLPNSISILNAVNWMGSNIGQITTALEVCLQANGMPILRKCMGNSENGGEWKYITPFECMVPVSSVITTQLFDINHSFTKANETGQVLDEINSLILNENTISLISADVFYISQIMETVATLNNRDPLNAYDTEHMFSIYNQLMRLDVNTTEKSSILNSTNILLSSFDQLINRFRFVEPLLQHKNVDGVRSIVKSNLMTHIIEPRWNNITGVSLYAFHDDDDREISADLLSYSIKWLFKNQSCKSLQQEPGLQIAAFVPEELLQQFEEEHDASAPLKIVISMFTNDVLFQVSDGKNEFILNSKIISISVPGHDTSNLSTPLPIFIRSKFVVASDRNAYAFWNYTLNSAWDESGGLTADIIDDRSLWINVTHLTHFAYLLHGKLNISKEQEDTLNIITLSGSILSLFGILGIFITAVTFRSWRAKSSAPLLLQLCTAIALQMIFLCFINTEAHTSYLLNEQNNYVGCIIIGAIHHYLILVVFVWMLIIAYLQFVRYVIVFNQLQSTGFFIKASCLSWSISAIPVIIVLAINPHLYIPDEQIQICYPTGYALYMGVMLPIAVIVVANVIVYIIVLYNLIWKPKTIVRTVERSETFSQLRLSIFLFFLLGLTWVFGFLAAVLGITGLIFSYLFCLTATIQGLVLFLYFIVLDPVARNLWIDYAKSLLGLNKKGSLNLKNKKLLTKKDLK